MATPETEIYKTIAIPGKGYGLVAKRPITPGTLILSEAPVMKISIPALRLTESDISHAFSLLSPADQTAVLSLHEGTAPDCSRLLRIFKANTFGDQTSCWLHPQICRINHSCVPNASIDRIDDAAPDGTAQVLAEKHIAPGEEICFSYNHDLYEITTARHRAVLLRKQYGFTCSCLACDPSSPEAAAAGFQSLSDVRRTMMKSLRERLQGLQTSDFSILERMEASGNDAIMALREDDFWVKEVPPTVRVPAAERAAKFVLLARLREAERLPALPIAESYMHAAQAMLEQVQSTADVVVLSWAQMVRAIMERAIALVDEVRSPFGDDAQMLRGTWKAMQERPCMKVALGFLDANNGIAFVRRKADVETPYAILITKDQQLLVISRAEYIAVTRPGNSLSFALQEVKPSAQHGPVSQGWRAKLRRQYRETSPLYKLMGAALTCAAPIAAYLLMR